MLRSLEIQIRSEDAVVTQPAIDFSGYSAYVSESRELERLKLTIKFSPTEFADFMYYMRRLEASLVDSK